MSFCCTIRQLKRFNSLSSGVCQRYRIKMKFVPFSVCGNKVKGNMGLVLSTRIWVANNFSNLVFHSASSIHTWILCKVFFFFTFVHVDTGLFVGVFFVWN